MTSIKNMSELLTRFDEICEIAQCEDVIIDFDKNKKGVGVDFAVKIKADSGD